MKTIPLFAILAASLLTGCATNSIPRRPAPNVAVVKQSISEAQVSATKARISVSETATAIRKAKAAADTLEAAAPAEDRARFLVLQTALSDAENRVSIATDQTKATVDALSTALLKSEDLQRQVDASEKEKSQLQDKSEADDKTISKQKAANDKLSREVWIYKGGVILFFMALVIGLAVFQIVRSGALVKIVAATAGFVWWLWLIVAGAVAALLVGWFWLLWKWLP